MGFVVPVSLMVRLVALGFALGIVVGLWIGIEGRQSGTEPAPPVVTTTTPSPDDAAP